MTRRTRDEAEADFRIQELRVRPVGRREFIRITGAGLGAGFAAALAQACYGEAGGGSADLVDPGVGGGDSGGPSFEPEPEPVAVADSEPEPTPEPDIAAELPADVLAEPEPKPAEVACDPLDGAGEILEEIAPISTNEEFYVVAYFGAKEVDLETWTLSIRIHGEEAAALDMAFLEGLELQKKVHTLQCIESRPTEMRMNNAIWSGRPLRDLLEAAEVQIPDDVKGIAFTGADTYSVGLPVADLHKPIWVVWEMNGQPLPLEHGFPARMLVPARFGWKNMKQLVSIDFVKSSDPTPAYAKIWKTDYHIQALTIWPSHLAILEDCKTVRLLGKAFAGTDPVEWVGVTTDGGETWEDTEITYGGKADVWTLWRYEWTPPGPGTYTLKLAARSEGGKETDPDIDPYAIPFTGGMAIDVEVL